MTGPIKPQGFSSTWAFILATIGGAVGLGNIWRFPVVAGENGGGAFIMMYFIFIIFLSVPAVIAMITIGRRGGHSPVASTRILAEAEGHSANWKYLGWTAITVSFFALSFFSVVAGWVLAYLVKAVTGIFTAINAAESKQLFADVRADTTGMVFWHGLFMVATISIVVRGVRDGVEMAAKIMMPLLFIVLIILVIYSAITAEFSRALKFMFYPDFSRINFSVVLLALGQAFFSLSVGGGGILAYGAYLSKEASIPFAAMAVATANVSVDLLAGLAIFPIVFAYKLEAAAGPGLLFESLPIAFGQMPGGWLFGTLFFLLVFFAALSTSISLLESVVCRLVEHRGGSRKVMATLAGGVIWLFGLGSVFSFNIWSDFKPLGFIHLLREATIFRIIDFVTVNVLVLISAFFICVFAGWILSEQSTREELAFKNVVIFRAWRFVMRYLAPAAIATVFVFGF